MESGGSARSPCYNGTQHRQKYQMRRRRPKGSGTVEKCGAKFRARKTVNGEALCGTLRSTKAEALRDLETLGKPKIQRGPEVPTLADYIEHEMLKGRFAAGPRKWALSTWETNEANWRNHIEPSAIGNTPLDQIRRKDVQAFADSLTVQPPTIRRILALVSKACEEAILDELIEVNFCRGIQLPRVEKRRNRVLTKSEAQSLTLDPTNRLEAMIFVATRTGLRVSEICALTWDQIDGMTIIEPGDKSEKSRQPIPITNAVLQALNAQPRRGKTIFTTESGRPVGRRNVTRDWHAWRDARGIDKRVRFHDLRGTFVTHLLGSGVDLRTVQALARHADPRMTLGVYAQAQLGAMTAAVAKLDRALRQMDKTQDKTHRKGNLMVGGTGLEPVTPTVSL
ncbi:MAG: tyrosine-type recombinase/integrase [Fimbriimonadaceae bacterium]|nr:tyrosine-type recombinase/integrase [Fimbriimonadaceae bacterium]